MPRKNYNDPESEYSHQVAFVNWLELKGLTFSALPLSTYTTSWNQKRMNYAMGVRAGVPDVLVITPKVLCFVEVKRPKNSATSAAQKVWIEELNKLPGVAAKICKGYEECVSFISQYL